VFLRTYYSQKPQCGSKLLTLSETVVRKAAHCDSGGALVQDGKLRPVVEQPGHAQALLLAQAELAAPVYNGVQAALALHQILQIHLR